MPEVVRLLYIDKVAQSEVHGLLKERNPLNECHHVRSFFTKGYNRYIYIYCICSHFVPPKTDIAPQKNWNWKTLPFSADGGHDKSKFEKINGKL